MIKTLTNNEYNSIITDYYKDQDTKPKRVYAFYHIKYKTVGFFYYYNSLVDTYEDAFNDLGPSNKNCYEKITFEKQLEHMKLKIFNNLTKNQMEKNVGKSKVLINLGTLNNESLVQFDQLNSLILTSSESMKNLVVVGGKETKEEIQGLKDLISMAIDSLYTLITEEVEKKPESIETTKLDTAKLNTAKLAASATTKNKKPITETTVSAEAEKIKKAAAEEAAEELEETEKTETPSEEQPATETEEVEESKENETEEESTTGEEVAVQPEEADKLIKAIDELKSDIRTAADEKYAANKDKVEFAQREREKYYGWVRKHFPEEHVINVDGKSRKAFVDSMINDVIAEIKGIAEEFIETEDLSNAVDKITSDKDFTEKVEPAGTDQDTDATSENSEEKPKTTTAAPAKQDITGTKESKQKDKNEASQVEVPEGTKIITEKEIVEAGINKSATLVISKKNTKLQNMTAVTNYLFDKYVDTLPSKETVVSLEGANLRLARKNEFGDNQAEAVEKFGNNKDLQEIVAKTWDELEDLRKAV